MSSKLSHLSNEKTHELMRRYYEDGAKVAVLIADYNLDIHPSTLVGAFPPYVHEDIICPYCNVPMVSKYRSRDYGNWATDTAICLECNHHAQQYCWCHNCKSLQEDLSLIEHEKKRSIIKRDYQPRRLQTSDLSQLTLKDALYLLSVFRHSLSEDYYSISPFSEHDPLLAPTHEYRNEITQHLYSKGFIAISADSDLDAFIFDEEITESREYYLSRVIWQFLPSMSDGEKHVFMRDLERLVKEQSWPASWQENITEQWRQISKYECFEYFNYLLRERGYEQQNYGPKTHTVFEAMLDNFSVAQIFNLSWQAVRDTTDYIVRNDLPTYHAKNTFIGAIQRKGEKALAEDWQVRCSRRDFNCPQTVISSTFADVFLGLGQAAFDMQPSY